jgi:hypothetical protein
MSSAVARDHTEILNRSASPSLIEELSGASNVVVYWLHSPQDNINSAWSDLALSRTLGERYSSILGQLEQVETECSLPNWDAEGAEAVSPSAIVLAKSLGVLLAKDFPQPEVTAGKRGEVVFDWIENQNRMVSAHVTPSRVIRFTYVYGDNRGLGSFVFTGRVDPRLTTQIQRLNE